MTNNMAELRSWLLAEHDGTVCADRLDVIFETLRQIQADGVQGDLVELGCFKGAMALWQRAILDELGGPTRTIHVFDSFAGLPAPTGADSDYLSAGDLVASPADVLAIHDKWTKRAPVIHPGWFEDTLPIGLPERIAFAYFDGDLYTSIMTSLTHCVPRIAPRGKIIIDDYADLDENPRAWDGLPGVKRASDDFFGTPSPITVLAGEGDLAFGLYTAAAS
ncbi:MAG TPA: methyltransferase [Micromonosporaceae bacterium]|nr:methyltransferase [Micromonosporaceae bacterium]HCU48781.1 methyltransferase [Micromonosporaceae bacterium]